MKQSLSKRRSKVSSALVITLLGVVLLTIIVVAFMQTMSLSLTTSKSYVDIRRATFAAQAGLDTAIAQMSSAAGTNLAFVTGLTNYPLGSKNIPVTLIGEGNLTNLDQVMPLVSGNTGSLTNFGVAGFSNNFNAYTAPLVSGNAARVIDMNTSPYQFIEWTNGIATGANVYNASWVTMTNTVGSKVSYTRYAYVVLDDAARINPALMTGTGIGYVNSTNWYSGPQDINASTMTNLMGGQLVTASQLAQITSMPALSNALGYSDATMGEAYASGASYASNRVFLTSRMNPSFDVIPAWYPNGGMPKYNINDLATNVAYGATGMARALNIASIITNNLPNFYMRDPALSVSDPTHYLYVSRLAANIVDYINPDYPNNVFYNSDYTYSTNTSGISPQGHGIYPVLIFERIYVISGAGSSASASMSSTFISQFWLSCWNPLTTPVTIHSADLHISSRPGYFLGAGGTTNAMPDYTNAVSVISGGPVGAPTTSGSATGPALVNPSYVVNPNEFIVMGFAPQTNTVSGNSTNGGPQSVSQTNNYNQTPSLLEQFALNINGQTTAQSGAQSRNAPLNAANMSGGLQSSSHQLSTTNTWVDENLSVYGPEVADPRFLSYHNYAWPSYGTTSEPYTNTSYWKGVQAGGSARTWEVIFPPSTAIVNTIGTSTWQNRDNIARSPARIGSTPTSSQMTPDQLAPAYNTSDSNAAPEVIRNGPMVSIGELGHIFDPANANDALTAVPSRPDGGGLSNSFSNGGARSLRIGRQEENGALAVLASEGVASSNWDVPGERAISLLDLFTVNNTNTSSTGANNNAVVALNMNNGGALGRINPNTASSNVLTALFSGIQITSDSALNPSGGATFFTNAGALASSVIANRPYSSLSDLNTNMPVFETNGNYSPNLPMTTASTWNDGGYAPPTFVYPKTLNVFNRVHQEAFGKLVQHLTVQSRSYRVFVIGQVLDSNQNPHSSVAMEAGVYLQYSPNSTPPKYVPVIQYLRVLK